MTNFSIIIPTFNRAAALDKCLQSLCDQTYKLFEVIICDDGSVDDTKLVIKKYETKLQFKYIYGENWGGPAKPRNRGIEQAKNEWICFLDSDDWWLPDKLAVCEKYTSSFDFIFHETDIYIDGIKSSMGLINKLLHFNHLRSPGNILISGNFIACSTVCVKKSLLNNTFFPEDKSIIALEDYYAWIELLSNNNIKSKFLKEQLSAYSLHSDNISSYNLGYLFKLFAFKRKVKTALNKDVSKSCINYLIGINLLELNKRSRANKFFKHAIINAGSVTTKIKSLIRLLT